MASLSNLSNEYIALVLDTLWPSDLLNVSVTCRRLWTVAEPFVKRDGELRARYKFLVPTDATNHHVVWDTLADVLTNPRLAYFVRDAYIEPQRLTFYDPTVHTTSDLGPESLRPPENQLRVFRRAVEESELITADSTLFPICEGLIKGKAPWIEAIEQGSEAPVLALLLSLLPNLNSISFTDSGGCEYLKSILKMAAKPLAAGKAPSAFGKLRTIDVDHWDTENGVDIDLVMYAAPLPAMRSIRGRMVDADDASEDTVLPSHVTELRFECSTINHRAMAQLLSSIEGLQHFEYQAGGAIVGPGGFNPRAMIATLQMYQRGSLKSLEIVDDSGEEWDGESEDEDGDDENSEITSLRDFTSLKTLRLELSMILPGDDEKTDAIQEDDAESRDEDNNDSARPDPPDTRLVDLLPPSLEVFKCDGMRLGDVPAVLGLLTLKQERLLELEELHVSMVSETDGIKEVLRKAGKGAGVKIHT